MIEAQVLIVADVVEAMLSHRPYRPALDLEIGLREININRGKLFRSDVVDKCIEVFGKDKFEFDNAFFITDWIS